MKTHFNKCSTPPLGGRPLGLVKCPRCGTEVINTSRNRPMPSRNHDQECKPQIVLGILECPQCKFQFRSRMEATIQQTDSTNVKELVDKIKGIREGFVQTLIALQKKIKTLEKERSNLLAEAEELRKAAESRADSLEDEVNQLRQDIKSLRELLDPASGESI